MENDGGELPLVLVQDASGNKNTCEFELKGSERERTLRRLSWSEILRERGTCEMYCI